MKKTFLTVVVLLLAWSNVDLKAQETITNAFDDLKRTGTVNTRTPKCDRLPRIRLYKNC